MESSKHQTYHILCLAQQLENVHIQHIPVWVELVPLHICGWNQYYLPYSAAHGVSIYTLQVNRIVWVELVYTESTHIYSTVWVESVLRTHYTVWVESEGGVSYIVWGGVSIYSAHTYLQCRWNQYSTVWVQSALSTYPTVWVELVLSTYPTCSVGEVTIQHILYMQCVGGVTIQHMHCGWS